MKRLSPELKVFSLAFVVAVFVVAFCRAGEKQVFQGQTKQGTAYRVTIEFAEKPPVAVAPVAPPPVILLQPLPVGTGRTVAYPPTGRPPYVFGWRLQAMAQETRAVVQRTRTVTREVGRVLFHPLARLRGDCP